MLRAIAGALILAEISLPQNQGAAQGGLKISMDVDLVTAR